MNTTAAALKAKWTVTAYSAHGRATAYDATSKTAVLPYFVAFAEAGITCELTSPAGHCHNAYRSTTGPVVVASDGSYRAA